MHKFFKNFVVRQNEGTKMMWLNREGTKKIETKKTQLSCWTPTEPRNRLSIRYRMLFFVMTGLRNHDFYWNSYSNKFVLILSFFIVGYKKKSNDFVIIIKTTFFSFWPEWLVQSQKMNQENENNDWLGEQFSEDLHRDKEELFTWRQKITGYYRGH